MNPLPDIVAEHRKALGLEKPAVAASKYGEECLLMSLFQCGHSVAEIAELMHWSITKTRMRLTKIGIGAARGKETSVGILKALYRMFQEDASQSKIAASFGIGNRQVFRNWLQYKSGFLALRILCLEYHLKVTAPAVRAYEMHQLGFADEFIARVLNCDVADAAKWANEVAAMALSLQLSIPVQTSPAVSCDREC